MRAKTMNIKLPVSIMDDKTMFSFSTLHKLHHKNLLHQWLVFSRPHSKIIFIFQHVSPNSGLFSGRKLEINFRILQDLWEP